MYVAYTRHPTGTVDPSSNLSFKRSGSQGRKVDWGILSNSLEFALWLSLQLSPKL